MQVNKVELDVNKIKVNEVRKDETDKEKGLENKQFNEMMPFDAQGCLERMEKINQDVKDVSESCSRLARPARGLEGGAGRALSVVDVGSLI